MKPYGSLLILAPLLLVTACRETPSDARVAEEPRSVERSTESGDDGTPRISLEDFLSLREESQESKLVVIDVRSGDNFLRGHIPGAVSIPLNDLGKRIPEISREAAIVTYCT